ncbi:MAG: hypothetical protein JWQ26_2542 [Modestobacter sp.]|jgi:hypothetical protein|nr:hypothetical protein [Modestobacter sp.]HEV7725446.1 hypothetical protein [Modestobacter sp.]
MDLRHLAFDRIFQNVVLRPLLVNYADRLQYGHAPEGAATGTCFIVLQWTVTDSMDAPPGSQLLTAQVHIPRHSSSEHLYVDFVLQRLWATLAGDATNGAITARLLRTSSELMTSDVDTIFKASTFEVAPAPPQRRAPTTLKLAPWTGWAALGATGSLPARGGVSSMN